MKDRPNYDLYLVDRNIKCIVCGHKGAVEYFGRWHPKGMGDKVDEIKTEEFKKIIEKYRDNPHMSNAMGYGGTIPYECTNCGNRGLVDIELEGYKKTFKTIIDF
jgi:hypothetical protein